MAGGSLVGLSAAIALSRLGITVTVLEHSPSRAGTDGRGLGLLDGQTVHGSLVSEALPGRVRERLATFAAANWPSPWREALAVALAGGTVFGTPIVHYKPRRLTRGRMALAGDAAHAASPMVGGGFREGLYDLAALAQVMAGPTATAAIPGALGRYQDLRLGPAVRHVTVSEQATAAYLAHAGLRPASRQREPGQPGPDVGCDGVGWLVGVDRDQDAPLGVVGDERARRLGVHLEPVPDHVGPVVRGQHIEHDLVGHEIAAGLVGSNLAAQRSPGAGFGPQQVTGGDVPGAGPGRQPLALRALARAGRSEQQQPHGAVAGGPGKSDAARSAGMTISRLTILPVPPLGSASTIHTCRGYL